MPPRTVYRRALALFALCALSPAASLLSVAAAPPASAPANCQNTGSFEHWLAAFRKEAAAHGVSPRTISVALDGMAFAPDIVARDRKQSFFAQTFLDFSGKLATKNRVDNGRRALGKHRKWFEKAEADYGVPGAVIAAYWALESDFGAGQGKLPVLRSLATLAYDCRRSEFFRGELLSALKIIDRGDLTPAEMIGSWAGELGQTQFLPSHYFNYAIDADGDGKRDLIRDSADVILSTANYIHHLGWRRGEPWLEEVRVPAELPWDQADLAIQHQRGKWGDWGVTYADGRPLPKDGMPASLLLPMGRHGPAFLAYANFTQVYLTWNQSLNYSTTAAYLATRLAGAAPMRAGNGPVVALPLAEVKELQMLLAKAGYNVGKPDGTIGAGTRAAVKAMQLKFGQPADSYPTHELLAALRRAGAHGGGRASAAAEPDTANESPKAPAAPPKRKARRPQPPTSSSSPFPWD